MFCLLSLSKVASIVNLVGTSVVANCGQYAPAAKFAISSVGFDAAAKGAVILLGIMVPSGTKSWVSPPRGCSVPFLS